MRLAAIVRNWAPDDHIIAPPTRVTTSAPAWSHIDTSDGSSTDDMTSDSDFTVVSSRRLKRKIRRTSPTGRQAPKQASSVRSYTISYVPTSTTDILNSLNRQSLSEYFELVAPGQVAEIRINARKNILSVEEASVSLHVCTDVEIVVAITSHPYVQFMVVSPPQLHATSVKRLDLVPGICKTGCQHTTVSSEIEDIIAVLCVTQPDRLTLPMQRSAIDSPITRTFVQSVARAERDTEERNPRQTSPPVAEPTTRLFGISTRLTGSGGGHSADLSTQGNLYLRSGGWYEVCRQFPNKVNHSEPWLYIKVGEQLT
ncbi:hypothetical protein HPB52_024662 [Rhipicephalus sanguineus]|uniref:Uncharacterized protein n=1 Tax=Rhipicephalus sanguineus TaxID=34632 RepID=A0A9D4YS22_RHISA|nr:hypothetical protein HPB52_024662 [Rhipicephalus sanguineus]